MTWFRSKIVPGSPPEPPQPVIEYDYKWDFTKSLTDEIKGFTPTLVAKSGVDAPVRTSEGVIFTEATQMIKFGEQQFPLKGRTIEFDVSSFKFKGNKTKHIRTLCFSNGKSTSQWNTYRMSPLVWRANTNIGWSMYGWKSATHTLDSACVWGDIWGDFSGDSDAVIECIDGKTVKIVISDDGSTTSLYLDNVLIGTFSGIYWKEVGSSASSAIRYSDYYMTFGGCDSFSQNSGDQCYDMKLAGLRIYKTPA